MSDWAGKSVVVTGGARGQGASLVTRLLQAGAVVHVVDLLRRDDTADVASGRLVEWQRDVADPATWEVLAHALRERGEVLHGLVHTAGITGPRNTVTRTVLADWEAVMSINLTGAMLGIRALAPLMSKGGSIVNVSSTVGMTGYFSAAYSTSKWALRGLTRSAALELAPRGIRVNCICPGVVDTELIRTSPALVELLAGAIPMRQMARPEQIADVAMFLLGPQSSYVTAADLAVDGGITGAGTYWPIARSLGVTAAAELHS